MDEVMDVITTEHYTRYPVVAGIRIMSSVL